MTLFDECIEALHPDVESLPFDQSVSYSRLMTLEYPIALNGRIDWDKVGNKRKITSYKDIMNLLKEHFDLDNFKIIIIWDGAHLPVVKSTLQKVLDNIDDVTAVGFDTWLYCPEYNYAIEFYHEGEITFGYVPCD